MIKPNNRIISLKIWYNSMSSFLLQNTIIPIQVTLHHCSHVLPQTIIPIQLTLLGVHQRSHVPLQSFSKALVLTIAVKVLEMLQHTNPLSLNWSWYWETFNLVCQNAQFLKFKNRQKGDQFCYPMSDFCENCNPHSSYPTTPIGKCLVDIWFFRNMWTDFVCFWNWHPPFWRINHANSAYFRLFLGYFGVISATRPPFWISVPLFTYPGSAPENSTSPISFKFGNQINIYLSTCLALVRIKNSQFGSNNMR